MSFGKMKYTMYGLLLVSHFLGLPASAVEDAGSSMPEEIIYVVRNQARDYHYYVSTGYSIEGPNKTMYQTGVPTQLIRYNTQTKKKTVLLEDKTGTIRDPQVHYDGKKILFSYRKGGEAPFHLYEIDIDGTNLRQLTKGIFDDYEPTYVPDGGIVFVSTRAKRWVNCWVTQVGTIHRCDGDGSNIRMLSANVEHDNTPWVLNDGRIAYTRWEYVDRSQMGFHHLWTMNPDGTSQMVAFGNMHGGNVYIDAKPIPGSSQLVLINSPGHGIIGHSGSVCLLSLENGPDDKSSLKTITKTGLFKDPYALSSDYFLAVGVNKEVKGRGVRNPKEPAHICVIDAKGTFTPIVEGRFSELNEPRPLIKRKRERVVPGLVDLKKKTGTLLLQDVTIGRKMKGVKKGEITKLLILETLPKPVNYGGYSWDMIPISWGGTFTIEGVLGTVPVESDGSAHFEVPANRSILFAALDKNNSCVKRMHSFLTVQPGETLSCVGCHEKRTAAPPNLKGLQALRRGPSPITPVPGVPQVIDYARHIQPIWDKNCISCHNPDKLKGDLDLSGDFGVAYFTSFIELFATGQISDGRNAKGNTAPRTVGDSNSNLMKMLDGTHHNAKPTPAEVRMVQTWINAGAPQTGTYAALGTGMLANRLKWSASPPGSWQPGKSMGDVFKRRCSACHNQKRGRGTPPTGETGQGMKVAGLRGIGDRDKWNNGKPGYRINVHRLYNLNRPEKSRILMAPLAKKAGGRDMGWYDYEKKRIVGGVHEVFKSKDDPDYQILLSVIQSASTYIKETDKRWHMEGFRPNSEYIREMIRYGILPETTKPDDPIDVFKTDNAYWRSFWHYPPGEAPKLYDNPETKEYFTKDHGHQKK